MSTNIRIDVTLQKLQEVANKTTEKNREEKKAREDDLAVEEKAAELSGERDGSVPPLGDLVDSLGQPLSRTGEPPSEKQKPNQADKSSVPNTYKKLDPGAGAFLPFGFCHCYFYDQFESTDTEYSKLITVYSADGKSSAEARVPIAIGLSIDLDIRPEEYFIKTGEPTAPTAPGTFEVANDQGSTFAVCALNNPVLPPFDPVPPGELNLAPVVDIFTGSSTSFLDIKQFRAPGDAESVEGYICLPVNKDVFLLIYTNRSAFCTSQLVRYEIFNSAVTGFEAVEEISELNCREEGYPTTVPDQTFLEGRNYAIYTVEASSQYLENTASASETRGGIVCFLVTPTSVKKIEVSSVLEAAVSRIFQPPPAPSETVSIGPINNFNTTVELVAGFDPSYRETLGFLHGNASKLYSYNLDGDLTIGGTPAAYYYLNDYEGQSLAGLSLSEIPSAFPDANFGRKNQFVYECELEDTEQGLKLVWYQRGINQPSSERAKMPQRLVGKSANLAFNRGSLGFPRVAVSAFAGEKGYCRQQLLALGFTEDDLTP